MTGGSRRPAGDGRPVTLATPLGPVVVSRAGRPSRRRARLTADVAALALALGMVAAVVAGLAPEPRPAMTLAEAPAPG